MTCAALAKDRAQQQICVKAMVSLWVPQLKEKSWPSEYPLATHGRPIL